MSPVMPLPRPRLPQSCRLLAIALWAVVASDPASVGEARAAGVCAPAPEHLATTESAVGGIGGTGHSGDGSEGGIGGTGIVGTITGFASVCVNGLEVHYDKQVPVSENGRASTAGALAVGQVVALEATAGARGLTARRIEVIHALEGPVTRSDAGRLEVMGSAVVAADNSLHGSLATLRPGDWVQVAGHRNGSGQWVATRVARTAVRPEVTLQGGVDAGDRIAGVRLEHAAGTRAVVGENRLVRGQWLAADSGAGDGRVRVHEIAAPGSAAVLARADRLIVETRVRLDSDGRVRTGHPELDRVLQGSGVQAGELVRVRAHRLEGGALEAERVDRSRHGAPSASDRRHDSGTQGEDRSEGRGRRERDKDHDIERDHRNPDRSGRDRNRSEREDRIERAERPERRGRD